MNYRPCWYYTRLVGTELSKQKALFHQVIMSGKAIIELENGKCLKVDLSDIEFLDSRELINDSWFEFIDINEHTTNDDYIRESISKHKELLPQIIMFKKAIIESDDGVSFLKINLLDIEFLS